MPFFLNSCVLFVIQSLSVVPHDQSLVLFCVYKKKKNDWLLLDIEAADLIMQHVVLCVDVLFFPPTHSLLGAAHKHILQRRFLQEQLLDDSVAKT